MLNVAAVLNAECHSRNLMLKSDQGGTLLIYCYTITMLSKKKKVGLISASLEFTSAIRSKTEKPRQNVAHV